MDKDIKLKDVTGISSMYGGPICRICTRYHEDSWTCDAFPDGIPFEIATNNHVHDTPYEGDNGILFTLRDDVPIELSPNWRREHPMLITPVVRCLDCKHHLGSLNIDPEEYSADYCEAFPNGIPTMIFRGMDHTKPFPGDNGIQFEPIEET